MKKIGYRHALLLGLALTPSVAFAQGAPGDDATVAPLQVSAPPLALDLTTRTTAGSRLDLTSLETPASVQTLSGDEIRVRGDQTINAAVTRAVGVTTQATSVNGGNNVAVRGFNADAVAFIYDGVRNEGGLGSVGFPYDPWTVDRIEVLNGPASVLFGTGAIGGAINIIPRRPSAAPSHTARVSAGSFSTYKAALDSTGPLFGDRLLYRFDISQQMSDDYVDRGRSRSTAISGALTYLASDNLKFTLSNDYGNLRPTTYYGIPLIDGALLKSLRKVNYSNTDVETYYHENTTRLDIDWRPSADIAVRNFSSLVLADRLYKRGTSNYLYQPATNDILRSNYGLYAQVQRQWDNQTEVRWTHKLLGLDNVLSGGVDLESLYLKRTGDSFPGTSVVDLHDQTPGLYPDSTPKSSRQEVRLHRYALFADDKLDLTPQLSVVGGLRYDHAHLDRYDPLSNTSADRTYHPVGWRVGAVYKVAPNASFYAQYSEATDFVNNVCCISAVQLTYRPSVGRQIEAGFKQSAWDGRLEWSIAAYRIRKTDLLTPDPLDPNVLIQVGAQSSRGLEATATFKLTRKLTIDANGTVLDPKYDRFQELVSGVPVSRDGNTPINVPKKSGNLWVNWQALPKLSAQAGVRYVGPQQVNTANTETFPSYTVVDASARWTVSDKLAVDVRVFNVLNSFYAPNFLGDGRGGAQYLLAPPRAFEVALTGRF